MPEEGAGGDTGLETGDGPELLLLLLPASSLGRSVGRPVASLALQGSLGVSQPEPEIRSLSPSLSRLFLSPLLPPLPPSWRQRWLRPRFEPLV